MNLNTLEIKQESDSTQNSLSVADTRLEHIIQNFVDNVIKTALHEISDNLKVMEIKANVSSLRLSPGKRSHQDFLDDTTKLCTPLVIFNDASQIELTAAQTVIKTPMQKVVDFSDPEQRHLWDKENYDPNTKQYSTDRKKKKVKGLSGKDDKTEFRVPLEDITKKTKVVRLDE
jgi:hypothetical protein